MHICIFTFLSTIAFARGLLDPAGSMDEFERQWTSIEQIYLESTFDVVCLLFVVCLLMDIVYWTLFTDGHCLLMDIVYWTLFTDGHCLLFCHVFVSPNNVSCCFILTIYLLDVY